MIQTSSFRKEGCGLTYYNEFCTMEIIHTCTFGGFLGNNKEGGVVHSYATSLNLIWYYIISQYITSHHITSYHIILLHITLHYISSHPISLPHTTSHHIASQRIKWHHITTCCSTSHHVITSHYMKSRQITSNHITAHHDASYRILESNDANPQKHIGLYCTKEHAQHISGPTPRNLPQISCFLLCFSK